MSAFGPREDLVYYVGFRDMHGIDETLTFVSSEWQMAVDLRLEVERQFKHNVPPQFRVLRPDGSWGDWHYLREGHPIHAQARAIQFKAAGGPGETDVGMNVRHFVEHPQHQMSHA
jgi:hypothetical protein